MSAKLSGVVKREKTQDFKAKIIIQSSVFERWIFTEVLSNEKESNQKAGDSEYDIYHYSYLP